MSALKVGLQAPWGSLAHPTTAGGARSSAHAHLLAGGGAPEVPGLHGPHVWFILFTRDYLLFLSVPTSRHDSLSASVSLA